MRRANKLKLKGGKKVQKQNTFIADHFNFGQLYWMRQCRVERESNHQDEKKIERKGKQRTNIKLDCWLLAGQHNLFTPLYFIVEAILSLYPFVHFSSSLRLYNVRCFSQNFSHYEWMCAPVHKILFDLQNIFWLSIAKDCITLMMVGKVSFGFFDTCKTPITINYVSARPWSHG